MAIEFNSTIAVLPAADVDASLAWWTNICGFHQVFRSGEPPNYAGIGRDAVLIHFALVTGKDLARTIGEQTMVRIGVGDIDAFYAEYQQRSGTVHPNGSLAETPWGGREFSAIDPNGVCVTFRA